MTSLINATGTNTLAYLVPCLLAKNHLVDTQRRKRLVDSSIVNQGISCLKPNVCRPNDFRPKGVGPCSVDGSVTEIKGF